MRSFLNGIRVWDYPNKQKFRKWVLTCCACYRIFFLPIKRYGHLKIPAKEQKKTQKIEATLHLL